MLRVVERPLASPAENLAFDDGLLENECETLRLWECPVPCVVLGRSSRLEEEVNLAACEADGVPLLRRSSGGGAVVLGPGCLNFALALSLAKRPQLANVPSSYPIILNWVAHGLRIPGLQIRGSDILLAGRKVSGNAQRRTKGWLLHHGTILYGLDLRVVERLLREPRRQPLHRLGRPHSQFLTTLPLRVDDIMERLASLAAQ